MEGTLGGGGLRPTMHDGAHHERVRDDGCAIRVVRWASSDCIGKDASLNEKLSEVLTDLAISPGACGDDLGSIHWDRVRLGTIQLLLALFDSAIRKLPGRLVGIEFW